jgi:two-component system OmpR family sensor kinase
VRLPPGRLPQLARLAAAWLTGASLQVRVMAAAAMLVMVTSAVMGALGTTLLSQYLYNRVDHQLRTFSSPRVISLLGHQLKIVSRPGGPQFPTDFLAEIIGAGDVVHVIPGSLHGTPPPKIPAARLHGPAALFTVTGPGSRGHAWRVVVRPLPGGRHAVIAVDLDNVISTIRQLEIADAVAGAAAIVLLAGIGVPLVRVSLSPLARIEDDAEAIAAGDLSRRIALPRGRTEVGRLAGALNVMLGRIETAYRAREQEQARALDSEDRMRRFVADASHELRTPLTSIRGLAELCLQQGPAVSSSEVTALMTGIQREAARMGLLVDDLLLLARLDEDRPLDLHPVDLASVAVEAVAGARAAQPGRSVTLATAADPVIVDADDARLRQVIDNLLSNALQHTPGGTPVTVTVQAGPAYGHLAVADAGPGLTAEQAARVFERFYRTDRARNRAHGGTGLGLSIVAALVAAHRGLITVDTQPGCGATFTVRLPLATGSDAADDR